MFSLKCEIQRAKEHKAKRKLLGAWNGTRGDQRDNKRG
jgi:hypothetical protein